MHMQAETTGERSETPTTPEPSGANDSLSTNLVHRWGFADDRDFLLRVVQPGLVGLIDGTISSLAPIFAAAITSSCPRRSR